MERTVLLFFTLFITQCITAQSVGIGTTSPNASSILHVDAGANLTKGILVSGTYNASGTVPDLGIGSRMMFYPGKGAFRAGAITTAGATNFWNDANVGLLSNALGGNNLASGFAATAIGISAKATGDYSMALGVGAIASGNSATAFAGGTASGGGSFAAGSGSVTSGTRSAAFGSENIAKGYASTVVGVYNDSILTTDQTAIDANTPLFVVGNGSFSNRNNAMVVLKHGGVGIGTNAPLNNALLHVYSGETTKGFIVSGEYAPGGTVPSLGAGSRMTFYPRKSAFRAGYVGGNQWDNSNVGNNSFAIGLNTIASANYSTAIGYGTKASGEAAFASGYLTEATGQISTAIGAFNTSSGEISTTIGRSLTAKGFSSTVVGTYNDPILISDQTAIASTTPLFIVGNGASGALSNAMVVLKNGNVGIGSNTPGNNLVINSSSPEFELQSSGVSKGFVQLAGDNLRLGCYSSNSGGAFIVRLNGADRFTVNPSGNATLSGTLTQNSDERLKENIAPINDALDKVLHLNGYEYNWKPGLQKDNSKQIGLIAQNVEKILPELVLTDKEGMKSVAYQNLVPVLIEAIKELQTMLHEQQSHNIEQQQQIDLLTQKLNVVK